MDTSSTHRFTTRGARIAGIIGVLIGGFWLLAWLGGWAANWGAVALTVKTNMSIGQLFSGIALLLAVSTVRKSLRRLAGVLGSVVLLLGLLTLSEHLFQLDLGIDQLVHTEPPGAIGTASPNRMGPLGSTSLALLGAGLLALLWKWRATTQTFGLMVCLINLFPAIGFLYGIEGFYSQPHLTGIAWPTVVALVSLGLGIILTRTEEGPIALLLRQDEGGALLRRLLPAVVLIPLVLGFLRMVGQAHGLYDSVTGGGLFVITLIVIFAAFLWYSAAGVSRENSARYAAEAALRQSEQRYRSLFENMTEGFALHEIITDEHGVPCDYRFLSVNASFERLTGFHSEDIVGRRFSEIVPDPDDSRVRLYGNVALTGTPIHFESYSAPLERWLEIIAYRPGPRQFTTIFTDITKRKLAEEALEKSEARFRLAIEHSQLMAWQCDSQMRFIWVYNSHFGVPDNDMIGKTFAELGIGESMKEFIAQSQEVLAKGAGVRRVISQVLPDGQEEYFDQQVEPVRDAQGIITGLVGISLNVTDRVRAEHLVHRSEEGYRLMIEHSTEPMLLVDESGRIDCISGKGARLLGFDQADLADTCVDRFLDWSAKLDLLMRAQDFRKHAPMPARGVLRIRQGNGEWCWIDLHASVVNYGQRPEKYLLKFEMISTDLSR